MTATYVVLLLLSNLLLDEVRALTATLAAIALYFAGGRLLDRRVQRH